MTVLCIASVLVPVVCLTVFGLIARRAPLGYEDDERGFCYGVKP